MCKIWAGKDGWATLALVIDCHTRELLGWHLSRSGKACTASSALEHALIARFGTLGRVPAPFLPRSDNGLVFTSRGFTALVRGYGLRQEFITPHCPRQKEWASYCTLCGWLNGDKCRGGRTVTPTLSLDEDDVAKRFEQATMLIAVTMLAQESILPPQVYRCRANGELSGELVGGQHAALAQTNETGLEMVGIADDDDLLVRER
ncbi:DDE-type integrase/transposase/recombinase, partial [Pseudoduganella namucuonensis]